MNWLNWKKILKKYFNKYFVKTIILLIHSNTDRHTYTQTLPMIVLTFGVRWKTCWCLNYYNACSMSLKCHASNNKFGRICSFLFCLVIAPLLKVMSMTRSTHSWKSLKPTNNTPLLSPDISYVNVTCVSCQVTCRDHVVEDKRGLYFSLRCKTCVCVCVCVWEREREREIPDVFYKNPTGPQGSDCIRSI